MTLTPAREIKLPIPVAHKSFEPGLFWSEPNSYWGGLRLTGDQRLLVLNPDPSGEWTLTRVDQWWTDSPKIESLMIPGWSSANADESLRTGLLVNGDSTYAFMLASVPKVRHGNEVPFLNQINPERSADTLVVAIDLRRWEIARAFHTASLGNFHFERAQVLDGKWIALQGRHYTPDAEKFDHVFERVNQLIAIPDLALGPGCVSGVSEGRKQNHLAERAAQSAALAKRNNAQCADLLKVVGLSSFHRFDSMMHLGEEPIPASFEIPERQVYYSVGGGEIDEQNFDEERVALNERSMTPDGDLMYADAPPYQSSTGLWYAIRQTAGERTKRLQRHDHAGNLVLKRSTELDTMQSCDRYGCDCRIDSVREEVDSILVSCRAYTRDSWGVEREKKHWLVVFRPSDLSEVVRIALPNIKGNRRALAVVEKRVFVLAVEQGRILRVYEVPSKVGEKGTNPSK